MRRVEADPRVDGLRSSDLPSRQRRLVDSGQQVLVTAPDSLADVCQNLVLEAQERRELVEQVTKRRAVLHILWRFHPIVLGHRRSHRVIARSSTEPEPMSPPVLLAVRRASRQGTCAPDRRTDRRSMPPHLRGRATRAGVCGGPIPGRSGEGRVGLADSQWWPSSSIGRGPELRCREKTQSAPRVNRSAL